MPGSGDSERTRRDVLKATAAVGVSAAATSTAASGSSGWNPVSDGSIESATDAGEILRAGDVYAPEATVDGDASMPTGQDLLERLTADGLLESASFDELPTEDLSTAGPEGVYKFTDGEVTNLGFRLQTEYGQLTVLFTTNAPPLAQLTTSNGSRVLYGTKDFETFSVEMRGLDDGLATPKAGSCPDCYCSGYPCCSTCIETRLVCEELYDGECTIVTNCAC